VLRHDDTIRTRPVTRVIGIPERGHRHTRQPRSFRYNSDNRERNAPVGAYLSAIPVAARGPYRGRSWHR
jgi:hypothetical protein